MGGGSTPWTLTRFLDISASFLYRWRKWRWFQPALPFFSNAFQIPERIKERTKETRAQHAHSDVTLYVNSHNAHASEAEFFPFSSAHAHCLFPSAFRPEAAEVIPALPASLETLYYF